MAPEGLLPPHFYDRSVLKDVSKGRDITHNLWKSDLPFLISCTLLYIASVQTVD